MASVVRERGHLQSTVSRSMDLEFQERILDLDDMSSNRDATNARGRGNQKLAVC